eukprot:1355405-Amorphochlora_amoeboformis.AAC.1
MSPVGTSSLWCVTELKPYVTTMCHTISTITTCHCGLSQGNIIPCHDAFTCDKAIDHSNRSVISRYLTSITLISSRLVTFFPEISDHEGKADWQRIWNGVPSEAVPGRERKKRGKVFGSSVLRGK